MNKKLVVVGTLPALVASFVLASDAASASIIQLTATGTVGAGSTIYDGTTNVTVPVGTLLTAVFLIDTDGFPVGAVNGTTIFNPDGSGGCRSVNLPQTPLLTSMMSGTVTVGGVTLQSQAAGNGRNCDYVAMNAEAGPGDALSVQQDANDSQTVYYVDGDLAVVSPVPTPFHITENRSQVLTLSGFFVNDPFSVDESLSELAQTFTLNSFYGASLSTEFGRGRYICPSANYCYNEPIVDGALYGLNAVITGLAGTVVPAPATFGLLGTAVAALGLAARRRMRRRS